MEEITCAQSCMAEGPYPEVRAEARHYRYGAAMLSNAAGGGVSEMSAIANYLYGSFTTPRWPEVADTFQHIAIVEMHHLSIFEELARQLGEDPRLWYRDRGRRRWWSPAMNTYPQRLGSLIQYALGEERATIRKYESEIHWIRDENILTNLRRIIEDEQVHIQILTCLLESYVKT